MPNARLPMNHARKILRWSREMKMSGRAIAKSLSQVLEKEKSSGEGENSLTVFPGRTGLGPSPSGTAEPQRGPSPSPLGGVRVTAKEHGFFYSRFGLHYAAYAKRLKPSFRNTYAQGDRLFLMERTFGDT